MCRKFIPQSVYIDRGVYAISRVLTVVSEPVFVVTTGDSLVRAETNVAHVSISASFVNAVILLIEETDW